MTAHATTPPATDTPAALLGDLILASWVAVRAEESATLRYIGTVTHFGDHVTRAELDAAREASVDAQVAVWQRLLAVAPREFADRRPKGPNQAPRDTTHHQRSPTS